MVFSKSSNSVRMECKTHLKPWTMNPSGWIMYRSSSKSPWRNVVFTSNCSRDVNFLQPPFSIPVWLLTSSQLEKIFLSSQCPSSAGTLWQLIWLCNTCCHHAYSLFCIPTCCAKPSFLLVIQPILMFGSLTRNPSQLTPTCLNFHPTRLLHNTLAHHHQWTRDNVEWVNNAVEF